MRYKCYVRGHGGEEPQKFPPAQHLPIDLVTVGEMGCTMSDEVADGIIYNHYGVSKIESSINDELIIYWTKEERDEYYKTGKLNYNNPKLVITPYDQIFWNLALDGDKEIGECGVCYWDENKSELVWLIRLDHKETILLSEILDKLKGMLNEGDEIELYWTACLSARYWTGHHRKVSRNPTKILVTN